MMFLSRLVRTILLVLIRFYQLVISPLLPVSCRFAPSCSHYAVDALTRFGVFRGSWMAAKRICRCHPWGDAGFDPVPQISEANNKKAK